MSWFGGGKKSDKARKRQIASLEAKDGKSYKLYKMARNHFRVTFGCKGFSDVMAIQIHLSEDFPESAPKISVDRKYSHHLLDDNGVVTKLPDLQKWSVHSDLGNIVQKITNMFNTSSPTIKQNFPASMQPPAPAMNAASGASSQPQWGLSSQLPSYSQHMGDRANSMPNHNHSPYGQPQAMGNPSQSMHAYGYNGNGNNNNNGNNNGMNEKDIDMNGGQSGNDFVDIPKLSPPSIIPGFSELTLSELEEMDKEPKLIEDFAYTVAATLREMKKESQNGCMQTAQQNIAAHESITELQSKNEETRANVETLTELYKNLKKREAKVLQKFSIPNIMNQIDAEMDKIDDQCETLKEKFQSKDEHTPLIIYVKKLAIMRSSYHMLAIKKEKLEKLSSRQQYF